MKWKKTRRYILGDNPCGNCSVSHRHNRCRPRLDRTLCTCSCEQADLIRTQYNFLRRTSPASDTDKSLVEMAVKDLLPRFKHHTS